MAKALGFFVIDSHRHYFPVHSRIEPDKLGEIRRELGLSDIVQNLEDTRRIEAGLHALQRKYDVETATDRWRQLSFDDDFSSVVDELRLQDLPQLRKAAMTRLRRIARSFGLRGGW